ncbi:MAG: nucleotidyltransferase family protein [Anaerolineae bacterium]
MQAPDIEAAREYHRAREARAYARREETRRQWRDRAREAIRRVAPHHPHVQRVYLFGSVTRPGRFHATSDIDVAVVCDTVAAESAFWRDLEQALQRDVDVRPLRGAIAEAVAQGGELVYER